MIIRGVDVCPVCGYDMETHPEYLCGNFGLDLMESGTIQKGESMTRQEAFAAIVALYREIQAMSNDERVDGLKRWFALSQQTDVTFGGKESTALWIEAVAAAKGNA